MLAFRCQEKLKTMKHENVLKRRLGVNDMAERLGVGRRKIERWAEIGILHPVIYSGKMFFKRTADVDFFDEWNGFDLSTDELARSAVIIKRQERNEQASANPKS